jgi:hypothetical protein
MSYRNKERFVMKTPQDVKPTEVKRKDRKAPRPDRNPTGHRQPAGRVVHDERGNAMWKWRGDVSTSGSGSGILKHLDPLDLKVEGHGSESGRSSAGGGYDPYNQDGKQRVAVEPRANGRIKR